MTLKKESLSLVRTLLGAPICILYALALAGGPLQVREIAEMTGYSRSATARGLQRLRRLHFVDYDHRNRSYTFAEAVFARALAGTPEESVASEILAPVLKQEDRVEKQRRLWEKLTPREQQILLLVNSHPTGEMPLTNRQIANRLSLSEETIRQYVRQLLRKLGLARRADLRRIFWDWDFPPY